MSEHGGKMLEYFTYKRFKKHQADKLKAAHAEEVLSQQDNEFLAHMVEDAPQEVPLKNRTVEGEVGSSSTIAGDDVGPPLPARPASAKKHTWKETGETLLDRAKSVKIPVVGSLGGITGMPAFSQVRKHKHEKQEETHQEPVNEDAQLTAEEKELHEALDRLNLAAQDGKAFSLSAETKDLLNKFTQILKDLVNGVPTAYDDLVKLFETSSSQIEGIFEQTPGFIKKLIKTIPLGAETKEGSSAESLEFATKTATLGIPTLLEFVKKPGSVATTLKTVLNALKLRFPGLAMGSSVLYSMGLFVLLFIFWYCYKRGREVRLEKEAKEAEASREILGSAPDVPTHEPGTTAAIEPTPVLADYAPVTPIEAPTPIEASTPIEAPSTAPAPRLPLNH